MSEEWRKSKSKLVDALSHLLELGLYTDVKFRVGRSAYQLNAHKVVLMAKSEVFAISFQDRWNNSGEQIENLNDIIVDLPEYSPEVFKLFLKETDLAETAKTFLIKNIMETIESGQFWKLNEQTLMDILDRDELEIEEVDLFNALIKWADIQIRVEPPVQGEEDELTSKGRIRREILENILSLIRFPVMGVKSFTTQVVPASILSDEEIIDMFMYFSLDSKHHPKFKRNPRRFQRCWKICSADATCSASGIDLNFYQGMMTDQQFQETSFKTVHQFSTKKNIFVRGFKLYGLAEPSFRALEYKLAYKITQHDFCLTDSPTLSVSATASLELSEPGNFEVLLDTPMYIQPFAIYTIDVKNTIRIVDLITRSGLHRRFEICPIQPRFCCGNGTIINTRDSQWEEEIGISLKHSETPFGIVHSIIYTIEE